MGAQGSYGRLDIKELIDLHVHSNASDGSFPPAEVVRYAKEGGLTAMALTDHDTVDGLPEAVAAGEQIGVEIIPGVEISAQFPGGTMHILGLFVDYHNGLLDERLAVLKQARIDRNPQIINKLNALGIPITMARVEEISGGGQVGRPHIARALMEAGSVRRSARGLRQVSGLAQARLRQQVPVSPGPGPGHDPGGARVSRSWPTRLPWIRARPMP